MAFHWPRAAMRSFLYTRDDTADSEKKGREILPSGPRRRVPV